jgi:hypothetical protein
VVAVQSRGQAVGPAFAAAVAYGGKSYVLRELMPSSDSLSLQSWICERSAMPDVHERHRLGADRLGILRHYAVRYEQDRFR